MCCRTSHRGRIWFASLGSPVAGVVMGLNHANSTSRHAWLKPCGALRTFDPDMGRYSEAKACKQRRHGIESADESQPPQ
jgi:hypothetical protein